jgi:hypothetical protein
MLIRSVTAHAFGPLAGVTLPFGDGMTVVHGANESAKSTWHAAIYAALCGRRRGRAPSAEERRFAELHRPWDRTDWVVSAEVLLDDGRRVEVRQDLAGRVDCDVRDLDLGRDCSDEFIADGTPDLARFLGLDRHSFLATACVVQAQVLAVHERAGGLQEHLQRAATTAGADRTAAAALAHIDTYRREQVGTERAPRRPLRLAVAAVDQAAGALRDANFAHTTYQERLVEVDSLRAEAADARDRLRRRETLAAARDSARAAAERAEAVRAKLAGVESLLAETGDTEPQSPAADESIAVDVTAALSAWDSRPAVPVPAADAVDDDDDASNGDIGGGRRDADDLNRLDIAGNAGGADRATNVGQAHGARDADRGGFTDSAGSSANARGADGDFGSAALVGDVAGAGRTHVTGASDSGPAGEADIADVGRSDGGSDTDGSDTDGSETHGSETHGNGEIAAALASGGDALSDATRRTESNGHHRADGGIIVDNGLISGAFVDDSSHRGNGGPIVHDGSDSRTSAIEIPVPRRGGSGADASTVDRDATGDRTDVHNGFDGSAGAVGRAGMDVIDERRATRTPDGAGLTDEELWDLARNLELAAPPVDPAIDERVAAARGRWSEASRLRSRGGRLMLTALVLAVVTAVAVAILLALSTVAVAGVVGVVLLTAAVLLGLRGWRLRRSGDPDPVRRVLDAALAEAAAALRVEQAAMAQRNAARSRAQRLGLPAHGAELRELARQQAARRLVAAREAQWARERAEASEQYERDVREAREQHEREVRAAHEQREREAQAAREQISRAQAEVSLARQRAEAEISATRQLAAQEISASHEQLTVTRQAAAEQLSEAQKAAAAKLSEAQRVAAEQLFAARQAAAEQLSEERRRARARVEAAGQAILAIRQRAAEQVLAAAARCGMTVASAGSGTEVDDDEIARVVAALREWLRAHAARLATLDVARRGWARLQSLLGLDPAVGTAEVARAVTDLRATVVATADQAATATTQARDLADGPHDGDLTDGDAEAVRVLREAVQQADARANLAEGARHGLAETLASVSEAEEALVRAGSELARLRELDQTLELTRTFLATAQERAHRTIAPVLVESVGRWLPGTTAGRYTAVIVDPEKLRVQVRGPAGRWRDADRLSHGTAEQVYLLLRIALAQHLSRPGTVCPLLLDDVTVHADAQRTEQILRLLLAVAAERQIILFTQQDQVRDWAQVHLDGPRHATHNLTTLAPV